MTEISKEAREDADRERAAFAWLLDNDARRGEQSVFHDTVTVMHNLALKARIPVSRDDVRRYRPRFVQWMNGEITDHQLVVYIEGRRLSEIRKNGGE